MAYLFDSDALSELARPRPLPAYCEWLATVPVAAQFTSATVIGELTAGALRARAPNHIRSFVEKLRRTIQVLPYDEEAAVICGRLRAALEDEGRPVGDNDLQIAAVAIQHDLQLVTGNVRHYERLIDHGLRMCPAFSGAR